MKKLLHTIIFITAFSSLQAQYLFTTSYSDYTPTYTLSSGFNTTTTPGYMWCGYQPQLNLGGWPWASQNLNIFVRGFGFSTMWTSYKIYEGNGGNCTGALTQITNGNGVSMKEVNNFNSTPQTTYVMAGAYNNGCYFIGLDNVGTVMSSVLYAFPSGIPANAPAPTKPFLTQDNTSTDFYITGAVNGEVYVLRVNLNGSIVWSQSIKMNGTAQPEDIEVYPSAAGKLFIAGHYQAGIGDEDAFLIELAALTGQVNNLQTFGVPNQNDAFNAITLSYAPGLNLGINIVLAGYVENALAVKQSWIYKMDENYNYIWSNILQPSTGTNSGIVDVLERLNTSNTYEFYALVNSNAGMVVLKLDDQGQPFTVSSTAPNNEFLYNLPGSINSRATCMSMISGNSNFSNMGLQVYGTANNFSYAASSHFVEAYFNGQTNCSFSLTVQNPSSPNLFSRSNANYIANAGLSTCPNFTALVFYPGGAINFPCSGYVWNGNNARTLATDLVAQSKEDASFKVSPNPAVSSVNIEFTAQEGASVLLELTDLVGRKMISKQIEANYSGSYEQKLEIDQTQLPQGVYFVNLTNAGHVQQQKLIVSQ